MVSKDKPVIIKIVGGSQTDEPQIILCFSQYYPVKTTYPVIVRPRLVWFKKCLDRVASLPDLQAVAFPEDIAGDGGGHWPDYQQAIDDMIQTIKLKRPNVRSTIYNDPSKNIEIVLTSPELMKSAPAVIGLRNVNRVAYQR
jgi:hypothetical protein